MTLTLDPSAGDPGRPPDAVDDHVGHLISRITADHPEVDPAQLERMVIDAYRRLERAPVQNFRLILTERAVRAGLDPERRRPPDQETRSR